MLEIPHILCLVGIHLSTCISGWLCSAKIWWYVILCSLLSLAFPHDLDMVATSCVLGVVCLEISNTFPSHDPSSCSMCTIDSLYSSLTHSCYYQTEEEVDLVGSLKEALIVLLNRLSFLILHSCLAINSLHSIIERPQHQRLGRSPNYITDF